MTSFSTGAYVPFVAQTLVGRQLPAGVHWHDRHFQLLQHVGEGSKRGQVAVVVDVIVHATPAHHHKILCGHLDAEDSVVVFNESNIKLC